MAPQSSVNNLAVSSLTNRRHLLLRMRFQLLGGLIFAILLPVLLRASFDERVLYTTNMQVTIIATAIAHISGFLSYRKIGNFPGEAAASYILPTFAVTYGLVFLTIFFFRFDYSRFQAASCFLLSVSWYFALAVVTRRVKPYKLAVIPGGEVDRLNAIGGVSWQQLVSPEQQITPFNGVVADLKADLSDDWERFIARSALAGVPVYHVKQIQESLTGRVEIEHLSENTLGSINPNLAYFKVKQMVDWLAALGVLILASPVLLLTAAIVRLDSSGPALFRQERVGYRATSFKVFKFRTMTSDTRSDRGDELAHAMTRPGDTRITRVGNFLRRTRLDELPQILNILRGEMSWIGPRPEAAVLSQWYENELPYYSYRHIVRPGITGWAQVNQGHVADVDDVREKLHYDFFYIKNFSPWLDLLIVFRTIRTVVTGFGAK